MNMSVLCIKYVLSIYRLLSHTLHSTKIFVLRVIFFLISTPIPLSSSLYLYSLLDFAQGHFCNSSIDGDVHFSYYIWMAYNIILDGIPLGEWNNEMNMEKNLTFTKLFATPVWRSGEELAPRRYQTERGTFKFNLRIWEYGGESAWRLQALVVNIIIC